MAAGQGNKIEASDYNAIQGIIAPVLGATPTSSGSYGYGQFVASNQVSQYAKITNAQWGNLRTDILRARQHQTGTDLTSTLTAPTAGVKITEADRAVYKAVADLANANKLSGTNGPNSLPATESTRETLYNDTFLNSWNGVLSATSTIQFASYDAARYFFNSRGQIEISSSRTGGTGGLKNATWTTMLDKVTGMGIIYFNYNTTINLLTNGASGSGTSFAIGFYNLTTSDQLIFEKLAPSGAYADNKFRIYAKLIDGTSGTNSCIQFTLQWRDDSANPNPTVYGPYGPFGVDENVDGIITSFIQSNRPSGNNVSLPAPTAGIANNFSLTTIPPNTSSYSISTSTSTTNEGTTINYTITTVNIPNNSIIYWTNSGSTSAADFTSGVNSGSITIQNNSATLSLSISNDQLTEGPENIQISLRTGSVAGPIVASSGSTVVNDTSLTPITYSITNSPSGYVTVGTVITYTVITQNFGNGALFWYDTGNYPNFNQFTDGLRGGSVPISNNYGSFTRTVANPHATLPSSTSSVELRLNSVGGVTVAYCTSNTLPATVDDHPPPSGV